MKNDGGVWGACFFLRCPLLTIPSLVLFSRILCHRRTGVQIFAPLESIGYALFCTLLLKYSCELFWGCGLPTTLFNPILRIPRQRLENNKSFAASSRTLAAKDFFRLITEN